MTCAPISKPRPRLRSIGVEHRVVMVAAVHPVERAVVHRLHAVFDGDVRACRPTLPSKSSTSSGTQSGRVPIDQADDLRMRERFFIHGPQSLDRRIGVGGRLKVGQEVAALAIAEPHPLDALVDLAADAGARQPAAGAEAAVVAERAAAGGNGAVDIGAGKAGIDADLLDPPAEPLAKMEICGEIGQTGLAPGRLQVVRRTRFG